MYEKGEGVTKDVTLAYIYFSLASATIPESAKARDELAKTMTPVQIAEAQLLTREWKTVTPSNQ